MVEISEKERNRRRVKRDADTTIPAQSFRFGADVRRDLIDKEFDRLFSSN